MGIVFCHVGLGDYVSANRAIAVIQVGSVTAKRRVSAARRLNLYIDASHGKGIRSYVLMDDNTVVASHLSAATIAKRFMADFDATSDYDGGTGGNDRLLPTVLHTPDGDEEEDEDEFEEEETDDEFEDEDESDLD